MFFFYLKKGEEHEPTYTVVITGKILDNYKGYL